MDFAMLEQVDYGYGLWITNMNKEPMDYEWIMNHEIWTNGLWMHHESKINGLGVHDGSWANECIMKHE